MSFNPSKCEVHGRNLSLVKTGHRSHSSRKLDLQWSSGETSVAAQQTSRHSVIRPQLSLTYVCQHIMGPHIKTNIQQLKANQWRAARDYRTTRSTSHVIGRLGWQHRRTIAKTIIMYRVTHHLIDNPAATFYIPPHVLHPVISSLTAGRMYALLLPSWVSDCGISCLSAWPHPQLRHLRGGDTLDVKALCTNLFSPNLISTTFQRGDCTTFTLYIVIIEEQFYRVGLCTYM